MRRRRRSRNCVGEDGVQIVERRRLSELERARGAEHAAEARVRWRVCAKQFPRVGFVLAVAERREEGVVHVLFADVGNGIRPRQLLIWVQGERERVAKGLEVAAPRRLEPEEGVAREEFERSCNVFFFGIVDVCAVASNKSLREAKKEHVTGTLEFLSCHALFGFESSRRCDLESLCYTLAFTLHPNQQLPWSDSIADVREEDMDDAFLTALGHRKHKTDARELFGADTPAHACFRRVLRTARALKFAQAPPFDDLDTVFTDAIAASSPSSHPHSS